MPLISYLYFTLFGGKLHNDRHDIIHIWSYKWQNYRTLSFRKIGKRKWGKIVLCQDIYLRSRSKDFTVGLTYLPMTVICVFHFIQWLFLSCLAPWTTPPGSKWKLFGQWINLSVGKSKFDWKQSWMVFSQMKIWTNENVQL